MSEELLKKLFNTWYEELSDFLKSPYFTRLITYLNGQYKLKWQKTFPKQKKDIFNVFSSTDLKEVKVVILGKEPSHLSGDYAYSISGDSISIDSASARIRDCIERKYTNGLLLDFDFTLSNWAKQGVLLLNTSLTSVYKKEQAHSTMWSKFIEHIISFLNKSKVGLIFVLWGPDLHKYEKLIDSTKHYIIKDVDIDIPLTEKLTWEGKSFDEIDAIIKNNNGQHSKIKWS